MDIIYSAFGARVRLDPFSGSQSCFFIAFIAQYRAVRLIDACVFLIASSPGDGSIGCLRLEEIRRPSQHRRVQSRQGG